MLRLAISQFRPEKGDYPANLRRLGEIFAQLAAGPQPPDLLLLPETALTGYFVEGGTRDLAVTAGTLFRDLAARHQAAGAPALDVAVGFYEEWQHRLYNSALYAALGGPDPGVVHVHRKVFLPTYGVFDEERYVASGRSVHAFDTRWGRAAILICEDAWHSLTPTVAALDGAQVLLVPSASPARGAAPAGAGGAEPLSRPANLSKWERIARDIAEEHGVWVAVAQLVGFEGGKAFAGGSVLATPRGEIVAQGPLWEEALIEARLDLEEITRARADQPLLADLEAKLPHLAVALERGASRLPGPPPFDPPSAARGAAGASEAPGAPVRPVAPGRPVAAGVPKAAAADGADPLAIDCALVERWLVEFLREAVPRRRGYGRGLVGLSGGVDSAVTAFLAARALGAEKVWGICLPYRSSSPDSLAHAERVIKVLGIKSRVMDISPAVDGYLEKAEPEADANRRGNVMARTRMIALFDQSAKLEALPLGTGNKTERLFGYFTWHADDSPPVNPLGDLFKTQVWALARHLGVPEEIVAKPATADLIRGQTDEDDLGISYPKADHILYRLLRGQSSEEIVALGFAPSEVELVRRRLESTHWKRRLPTVAMLSQTAIGEYYLRPVDY